MNADASKRHRLQARMASVWSDPRLLIWLGLSILGTPILFLLKARRDIRRNGSNEFNRERWNLPAPTPELTAAIVESDKPHVIFVGSSFGEMTMVERVANELRAARPDVNITYCIRDPDARRSLQKDRPNQAFAIWPFDVLIPMARWLRQQQPDVLIFTERFRFTTFSCAAARFGAEVMVMNGRCRTRESLFYKLSGPIYRWQFGAFSALAMQREDFYRAAHRFARKDCDIQLTGDLKADLKRRELESDRAASLTCWLNEGRTEPLVVAGSTSNPEEELMVLATFRQLRERVPGVHLLIAPRRVDRVDEVVKLIEKEGWTVSRRSAGGPKADIYVLDTLGELAYAYQFGVAAYVGGAFGKGDGHNVMEPLEWGVPVSYGMNRGHFMALQLMCESAGVGTRIATAENLVDFFERFIRDAEQCASVGAAGKKLMDDSRGAVAKTLATILPLIEKVDRKRGQP